MYKQQYYDKILTEKFRIKNDYSAWKQSIFFIFKYKGSLDQRKKDLSGVSHAMVVET